MADHLLVPVDDSDRSEQALEYALETYPNARVTALHVLDPADFYEPAGFDTAPAADYGALQEAQERRGEEILDSAEALAATDDRDVETEQRVGDISRSIVEYAEETDVDEVVMGSHGRTGASRVLLGSVAESVARRSPVPVTIVR